jgi:RNase P/RNase MRP subunit p29
MNATKNNIHMHEFIGNDVQILSSSDGRFDGKSVKIVDETKNTLKISLEGKERTIPKKGTVLSMRIGNEDIRINTSDLMFRPEDRIKKARKKKAVT